MRIYVVYIPYESVLLFGKGTTTSIYCHVFNQAQARAGDAIASVLDFKKHDTDKGQPEAV